MARGKGNHGWSVVRLAVVAVMCCLNVAAHRHAARPTVAEASDLVYLFHRPAEPVFSLRGVHRNVAFDVPRPYLPERYRHVAQEIRAAALRSGARLILVPNLPMPEKEFADVNGILPYRSPFTISAPTFLNLVRRFWHFFRDSKTVPELVAKAVWARLHFNPEMILHTLLLTMLRSSLKGVKDVQIPELPQYIPELYTDDEFFAKVREEMYFLPEKNRIPVPVLRNVTADKESPLWYFREDPNYNVFHWKWHARYPMGYDDPQYVDLPRRGELFVHLHRQIVARYNAERLH
ncbi:phenoloxidase 2-like [Thrips palmi]|uniref:Phenoloxidase 2-like n=1 Tax=Thrips palmi TaxID=161013 RepID=A0A6P8ZI14_THRPL|nr:phenoloxidase 2-like [Thrips palmi]